MILASIGITGSKAAAATASIVTTGLQVYIDPAVKPPVDDVVYDAKESSSVICGYINNWASVYNSSSFGGIFQLNGTDQWISLFKVAASFYYRLTFTAGFTFQIVMRKSNAGGGFKYPSTFVGNNQNPNKLKVYDSAFARTNFFFESNYGYTEFASPDNGITDWCMYTFVSSNAENSTVSLYKNNVTTPYTISDRSMASGYFDYFVLGNYDNGGVPFKGDIGAFTFYNRVLTSTEIVQNYNALTPRFGI